MTLDRWLTIIIGAVGFIATWFFARYYYKRSDKRRIPTFAVSAQRKALAHPDLSNVRGVSLVSGPVSSNAPVFVGSKGISEVEVYFWNSGTLPILADEVLEQFMIGVAAPILDFSVPKSSRESIDFRVSGLKGNGHILLLSFSVLEPGDGATVRIVYDGPEKMAIECHGACLDAPKPMVLPSSPIYSVPIPKRFMGMLEPLIAGIALPRFLRPSGGFS